MPKAAKPGKRATTFATLDYAETSNVVFVLNRERNNVNRLLAVHDDAEREHLRPYLDALDALHDRLSKRLTVHHRKLGISPDAR